MTDNTMREGKLWAFLHDSIHEAYKKLSTTGTSNEYHALLDSIASKVADDVDARFMQACAARTVPEASSSIFASRCPMCSYQHGHQIGCENNPIDIALRAAAQEQKK